MSYWLRLCRWMLNAIAPIVPSAMRADWRREWYGELWHWIGERAKAGDREALRVALSHCRGAIADAVYLRRSDEATRLLVRRITGHPTFCLAVMAVMLAGIAIASRGFEHSQRYLRPIPYQAPEQLVIVRQEGFFMGARLGLPLVKMENWKEATKLQGIAPYVGYSALAEVGGTASEVTAAAVDPAIFEVLGVRAARGKTFDELPGGRCPNCAMVSDSFWRTALGADPQAVGKSYRIAGRDLRVIGVLPKQFWFFAHSPGVWTLLADADWLDPRAALVYGVARLKPGVTIEEASAEMVRLYFALPPLMRGRQLELVPLPPLTRDPMYRWLPVGCMAGFVLFGAVLWLSKRAPRLRAMAYFLTKLSLGWCVVASGVVEFAQSPGGELSGVRGFGSETVSLWLLIVAAMIAVSWAWHDDRKRCRTCLCRLSMPVQMGSRGHILMEWMSMELVCPNGHGLLWAPEDQLESHPKDQWLRLDETWRDLFAIPGKPR
jgi:hypothetical protein